MFINKLSTKYTQTNNLKFLTSLCLYV